MKARYVIIVVIAVLLIGAALTVTSRLMRPTLVSATPSAGEVSVPVPSPLRLVFSRPMDHDSVTNHLKIDPPTNGTYSWDERSLVFSPELPWAAGETISIRLEAGSRATSWLAFPMQGASWSFTTSGSTLAYLWPSDGLADIYALDPSSGDIRQYTHGMNVQEFSTSRDGLWLYFSAGNTQGGVDLYQLDRKALTSAEGDSYHPTRLMDCGTAQCRSPVVSPDGSYLAYEHFSPTLNSSMGPAVVRLVSLKDFADVPLDLDVEETVQPAWSSRGWLAYYNRTRQEYEIFDPQSKERWQLANQTGQPGCWSADGNFYLAPEIYYHKAVDNTETGTSHLLVYDVRSGASRDLSVLNDVEDVEGVYSPDGGTLAFARKYLKEGKWSLGRQLWIMNEDGSNLHPLTNEVNFNHYDLAWSLDGLQLAYVRFDQIKVSDPPELWLINADGSNPLQLVIGGYSPVWIP